MKYKNFKNAIKYKKANNKLENNFEFIKIVKI